MSLEGLSARLRGQTAIITGSSSGVGAATAHALSSVGVNVVLVARRKQKLEEVQAAIREVNGQVEICAGDASEENTAQRAVELAMRRFGGVGILVNNAGQGSYKPFIETSPAEYDDLMRANVRSSFLFSRAVAAHMIEARSGVIIFVSSVAGLAGQANEVAYSTTKFAQVGMAQSLAEELRGYGVKVCALCPGGVKTEFAIGRGRTPESVAASHMMDAAEVAENIVFLCMQPPNVRIPHLTVRHMGAPNPVSKK